MEEEQLFIWDDNFSVGDDKMDAHHKQFIDIINKYEKAYLEGNADDISLQIIEELLHYAILHFKEEELLMKSIDYPGLDSHVKHHRYLTHQLIEYRSKIKKHSPIVHLELLHFIKEWWDEHIMEIDMRYFDYLDI